MHLLGDNSVILLADNTGDCPYNNLSKLEIWRKNMSERIMIIVGVPACVVDVTLAPEFMTRLWHMAQGNLFCAMMIFHHENMV